MWARRAARAPRGWEVPMPKSRPEYAVPQRRHPRLVRASERLRRHRTLVGVAAAALIGLFFALDLWTSERFLWGLYLIPLTLLAVAMRERIVALATVVCALLGVVAMVVADTLDLQ